MENPYDLAGKIDCGCDHAVRLDPEWLFTVPSLQAPGYGAVRREHDGDGRLQPRFNEYHAEMRELDDLMFSLEESCRKMRVSVILWARSHANLAAGIAVPPQIDVAGMLTGAASNAAKKVVP